MNDGARKPMRQAVVIIHGIGEQRPLDTLRGFVKAVARGKVRNKPDRLSESFELRRFTLARNRQQGVPTTDMYELYWAHHMREGRWQATIAWVFRLIGRMPSRVPAGLRSVHCAIWISIALTCLALVASVVAYVGDDESIFVKVASMYSTWGAVVLLAANVLFGRIVLHYVADAARYLTPAPDNIEARGKLRAEGVRLLRKLHEDGSYSRIVLVGHSLGSVIGYDVLHRLWDELRTPDFSKALSQPVAAGFDVDVARVREMSDAKKRKSNVAAFQQVQHRLWREQRAVNVPWLVTDFVTLGSPLAHAELLLESKTVSLSQRQAEHELPTCPPSSDNEGVFYTKTRDVLSVVPTKRWTWRLAHHGAVFSSTRWTNLYMPHERLILGDLIGGPLAPVFGPGIRDVPVKPSVPGFLARTLLSHVHYWSMPSASTSLPSASTKQRSSTARNLEEPETKDTLIALSAALLLDAERSREPWP